MLYIGPEQQLKNFVDPYGRILIANSYKELITALHKLDIKRKYLVDIKSEPVWYFLLTCGKGWQAIRLMNDNLLKMEEITYTQICEIFKIKATEHTEE